MFAARPFCAPRLCTQPTAFHIVHCSPFSQDCVASFINHILKFAHIPTAAGLINGYEMKLAVNTGVTMQTVIQTVDYMGTHTFCHK